MPSSNNRFIDKNKKEPIGSYEYMADSYAKIVDVKPIHIFYERPNTWALLPRELYGLKVLDVGCGSGWYARQLLDSGCVVTAIDASQKMIDWTSKRLNNQGRFIKANLEEPLNFLADDEFDLIIAPLVIHYIKEWDVLFKEFARILKPRGCFIFSTQQPHTQYYRSKLDNYYHKQIIIEQWKEPSVEVQFYHHTLHELTESLYHAGFLIERMTEPLPQEGLKQNLEMYHLILKQPWFLFVRAIKKG